jgi:hypothetical protein
MNIEYAFIFTKRETVVRNEHTEYDRQSVGDNRTVLHYGLRVYVPVKDTFTFPTLKKEA